jgi:predicted amidohydrolase
MLICEDAWHAIVPTFAAVKGARLLIIPSASPGRGIEGTGELESIAQWREMLRSVAIEHGLFVIYAGLTGFEGGKGMTGSSCVIDPRGNILVQAPALEACIVRADLDLREIELARANTAARRLCRRASRSVARSRTSVPREAGANAASH